MQRIGLIAITLVLVLCTGLAVWLGTWLRGPDPIVGKYPNQQQIQIRQEDDSSGSKKTTILTTTFETTDSWDEIIRHYRAILGPRNGDWRTLGSDTHPQGNVSQYNRVVFWYNEEYFRPQATFTIVGVIKGDLGLVEVTTYFRH